MAKSRKATKRNPMAKAVRTPLYRQRVIKSAKVYVRAKGKALCPDPSPPTCGNSPICRASNSVRSI